SRKARPSPAPHDRRSTMFPHVELNYPVLRGLHERVRDDGAALVCADALEYLERYGVARGSGALTARKRAFIEGLGAGYVDLSPALRAAPSNPQFECDMHFNEVGHDVVAATLAGWFERALGGDIGRPGAP